MASIADIVGMGIDDTNNLVFAWFADKMVSAGTSTHLSAKRKPQPYTLPEGKKPSDIVGMGIDGTNNLVFAWYRDRTVSAGTSTNLAAVRSPEPYELPTGKSPDDIVGMGIDGRNNLVLAWYRDSTVSAGDSRHLGSKRPPTPYTLASGKTPADVVEMGVDGLIGPLSGVLDLIGDVGGEDVEKELEPFIGKSLVFAWYRDSTVSAGRSTQLEAARSARPFTL